jgi:phenylacetic acid degradation operon negative regulatory protein
MKPQSLLFTIFGVYVRPYGNEIWVGSLTRLLGEFGMTEQAVRAAISRMLKQGWLKSRKVGNRSYYSMSERGKSRLYEAASRIYKVETETWKKRWCIVSYSIPEERRHLRDEFRKELSYLGFGMLTNSTWISPNELYERVVEIVQAHGIQSYVEVFYADHLGWSNPKQLVEKCWDINEINEAYSRFIEKYRPLYEQAAESFRSKKTAYDDSRCFVEVTQLVHEYRKFLFIDPDLPAELLPERWLGTEADHLFQAYHALLHPGALRFFDKVYEPVPV